MFTSKKHIIIFLVEHMNSKKIALSQDVLVLVDKTNNKLVKFFDVVTGKPLNFTLEH